jgi:hypothetical protein
MEEEMVVEAVEELEVRLLILEGRVVLVVMERAMELRKLLLWEMVAGIE